MRSCCIFCRNVKTIMSKVNMANICILPKVFINYRKLNKINYTVEIELLVKFYND